jgi:hypothetical protein
MLWIALLLIGLVLLVLISRSKKWRGGDGGYVGPDSGGSAAGCDSGVNSFYDSSAAGAGFEGGGGDFGGGGADSGWDSGDSGGGDAGGGDGGGGGGD